MLVVIDAVGLTPSLLGEATPRLSELAGRGTLVPLTPVLPAVTCTAQATLLTGLWPRDHGVVANGWYYRDLAQVWFWRQANQLVGGRKLYEELREHDPSFRAAKLFWWFNMYAAVDYAVTPRPAYPADGRKIPDLYAEPPELRRELLERLGAFPLFKFWGPAAGIEATCWIVGASLHVLERYRPDLALVYLPHLDYNLQRLGPGDARLASDLRALDAEIGRLLDASAALGADVVVLSEYGMERVSLPLAINRALREAGYLRVHRQVDGEHLDAGASRAFAVVDHQVAHIYVRDPCDLERVKTLVAGLEGVERVLDERGKREHGLDHARSGELVAVAEAGAWFSYYYWLEESAAPDYARTVDIHRKPGYDPAELFLDPRIRLPRVKIASKLVLKGLGMRTLMDVIPLDATLVKGSHGRLPSRPEEGPLFLTARPRGARGPMHMTEVKGVLRDLYLSSLRGP
ncbi:MAG: nucleotide pyrophosphatase/phosphodiesterase family protein [Planctomycetota bacterium]